MRYCLENECLKVQIESFGAEIKSVIGKKSEKEYMWCGDKKFWGRNSPVLFPFVGSLKNKEYRFKGKTYPMGQHGFARDMEHELLFHTSDEIWFSLKSNVETIEKYPFDFELNIGYKLSGNHIDVLWRVINTGCEIMYFSIGAHPAFNCPINSKDPDKYGYSLSFDDVDEIYHHGNDVTSGMALREDLMLSLKDHKAEIVPGFFDRCTYMVEGNQTGGVGLIDRNGNEYVKVLFDTPLFAIWSPEGKDAPFVCIEPWFGRCDAIDFEGELENREYTNVLEASKAFEAGYRMEFCLDK